MRKRIVIVGAGGHGKVIADIAKQNKYDHILFLDDDEEVTHCGEHPVVGKTDMYDHYLDCDFIVAIGNGAIREKIQSKLRNNGIHIVSLIHPKAVVAEDVKIGMGTVVMAGAIVNSGTVIGEGCIINTASSVDHDNRIDNFAHISVGSHLAGTVHVGQSTMIGAGAVVSNNVNICGNCMIGAGAAVVKDIKKSGTYIGVPARLMK